MLGDSAVPTLENCTPQQQLSTSPSADFLGVGGRTPSNSYCVEDLESKSSLPPSCSTDGILHAQPEQWSKLAPWAGAADSSEGTDTDLAIAISGLLSQLEKQPKAVNKPEKRGDDSPTSAPSQQLTSSASTSMISNNVNNITLNVGAPLQAVSSIHSDSSVVSPSSIHSPPTEAVSQSSPHILQPVNSTVSNSASSVPQSLSTQHLQSQLQQQQLMQQQQMLQQQQQQLQQLQLQQQLLQKQLLQQQHTTQSSHHGSSHSQPQAIHTTHSSNHPSSSHHGGAHHPPHHSHTSHSPQPPPTFTATAITPTHGGSKSTPFFHASTGPTTVTVCPPPPPPPPASSSSPDNSNTWISSALSGKSTIASPTLITNPFTGPDASSAGGPRTIQTSPLQSRDVLAIPDPKHEIDMSKVGGVVMLNEKCYMTMPALLLFPVTVPSHGNVATSTTTTSSPPTQQVSVEPPPPTAPPSTTGLRHNFGVFRHGSITQQPDGIHVDPSYVAPSPSTRVSVPPSPSQRFVVVPSPSNAQRPYPVPHSPSNTRRSIPQSPSGIVIQPGATTLHRGSIPTTAGAVSVGGPPGLPSISPKNAAYQQISVGGPPSLGNRTADASFREMVDQMAWSNVPGCKIQPGFIQKRFNRPNLQVDSASLATASSVANALSATAISTSVGMPMPPMGPTVVTSGGAMTDHSESSPKSGNESPNSPENSASHGQMCTHREYWKRQRTKRGLGHYVCLHCGAKWRMKNVIDREEWKQHGVGVGGVMVGGIPGLPGGPDDLSGAGLTGGGLTIVTATSPSNATPMVSVPGLQQPQQPPISPFHGNVMVVAPPSVSLSSGPPPPPPPASTSISTSGLTPTPAMMLMAASMQEAMLSSVGMGGGAGIGTSGSGGSAGPTPMMVFSAHAPSSVPSSASTGGSSVTTPSVTVSQNLGVGGGGNILTSQAPSGPS